MKPSLDFDTQLHSIPIRNENVLVFPADNKPDVTIAEVNLRYRGVLRIAKLLFKPREMRRFELAGLTLELYERLDGKSTVEDLVVDLADSEKLTFFEARAFVVQFLKNLMERGLIVIVSDGKSVNPNIS